MIVPVTVLSLLWALAGGGVAWHCAGIARQITYVTLADGRRQERRLPLLFRLLLPLAPNVTPLFGGAAFERSREALTRRITAAGFEGLLAAEEFLALRVLLPLIPGLLWILFAAGALRAGGPAFLQRMTIPLCLLGPLWFAVYPALWLRRALTARHNSIRRALPFLLDILTLSVEAGIDFMTALQRYVERRHVDPLIEELVRVIREIQVGKTRREALRDMSRRLDLPDLRSVINALVQADELGVSIGSILRIQSDQIRQRRFERAEKLAHEAPVKMLMPLLLFIFPAVFLILLGPVLYQLLLQGF
jgi:tight adherence protein C